MGLFNSNHIGQKAHNIQIYQVQQSTVLTYVKDNRMYTNNAMAAILFGRSVIYKNH